MAESGSRTRTRTPRPNTINVVTLGADKLRSLEPGFESIEMVLDTNRATFEQRLDQFADGLDRNTTAFFYYAGHGVQIDGQNYILSEDLQGLINVRDLLKKLRGESRGVVAVLDACHQ